MVNVHTRRFNDDSKDSLILETIHYHTINEPQYLKNLVSALDEMNLPTGEDKKNPLIDGKANFQTDRRMEIRQNLLQ